MRSTQFTSHFYKNFIIIKSPKYSVKIILLVCALSATNFYAFSQEFSKKSMERIPINLKDSLKTSVKDSLKLKPKPKDSLKKSKEFLESIIMHSADSLIRQDVKNNKISLFKNAHVTYKDIDLTAGFIEINNNNNLVVAKGIKDSIGSYSQLPVFKQGNDETTQDSIAFNIKTEKAKIYGLRTEQQGIIIKGEITKKENDSVIYVRNIKFTTSKKEHPDFYIKTSKAKIIPNKKLVVGLSNLVVADVPTPLFLPFAYIPLNKGASSGFLMPTWGQNNTQGYFLQNGGYYLAINDYFDLALLGDFYTNGSWGFRTESNYVVRYKFSGNFSFRYENLINSLRGFSDYSRTTNFNIKWSHSQDSKASPNSRFSASVNLGSSKYYKQSLNEFNSNDFLNNTLSSSISYSKNFVGTPFNMALSVTHSQITNTNSITMSLPSLQVNMNRIYPFASKYGSNNNAIQKIGLTYTLTGDNRINTTDQYFLKKEMFRTAKSGLQQNISLGTNMKFLKFFTISPSATYREVWYFDKISKTYNPTINLIQTDTLKGFDAFREYSGSLSLSTTIYGVKNFKKGRLKSIRHVMYPTISYGYKPDFSKYYREVQQSADPNDVLIYSEFQNGIYGTPSKGLSNSINFGLKNILEAKVMSKDSTKTEPEKITLINNLNFSTSYDFAADSLKWRPLIMNAGTDFFNKKLTLNLNATFDPYAISADGRKINKFNIDAGGGLFRVTNAGLTMNYSLSSKKNDKKTNNQSNQNQNDFSGIFGENLNVSNDLSNDKPSKNKKAKLYNARFPWTLRLAYTINYSNYIRENTISSNSLMFSGDVDLTPKWKVGFNSGYDFKQKGFAYTQLHFSRDLDSWKLNFNWVPFGVRQTYYFYIGVKSSILSDLKYDKTKVPDQRLF